MKHLLFLFLLLVLLPPATSAQQRSILQGERELVKWRQVIKLDIDMIKMLCGEYFWFLPTNEQSDPGWVIGYMMKRRADDPPDIDIQLFGLFLPETLRVRIDASKKVPTAELILTPAVEIDNVIIRISAGDYKKSPCLAKVKKE